MFADQEAPEWLPANVLRFARYSEKSIRVFTEAVIDSVITGTLKFSMIRKQIISYEQVDEVKAILGSLKVIISNAAKQRMTENMLSCDLQVLGLPYHYQLSICRPYVDYKIELQEVLASKLLFLSDEVNFDWNIYTMVNDTDNQVLSNEIAFQLSSPSGILKVSNGKQEKLSVCTITCSEKMYYQLSQELQKAKSLLSIYTTNHLFVCL